MAAVWAHRVLSWLGWAVIGAWVVWVVWKIVFLLPDLPWMWQGLVAGIGCLIVRGFASGEVRRRIYTQAQPGTGTITRLKYRGSWGTGSENATQFHWFDVRFRVVPAAASGLAPFEGFSRLSLPLSQKDRLSVGLSVPVVYDSATGITLLSFDGGIGDFAMGRTLRMAARVRRRDRTIVR